MVLWRLNVSKYGTKGRICGVVMKVQSANVVVRLQFIDIIDIVLVYVGSLVPGPRPFPAFQCCTLKNERAWYLKSRA